MVDDKSGNEKQSTMSAGHFDCHDGAPVQYEAHCPMQHAQGYSGKTGCRHWMTTRSVLPNFLPGQQANKQQSTNTPTKLAVLMAIAMRRYNTVCIAKWRRSTASLEATGCHHWVSTCSDSHQSDMPTPVFSDVFHPQIVEKGHKAQG
jgi:hypothetical protein